MAETMTEWCCGPIVGFDTETTSPDPGTAHVVTVSIVLSDPGLCKKWARNWLIDPGVEISDEAARTRGIESSVLKESGMKPDEALSEMCDSFQRILQRWGPVPLAVFNAPYDLTIIHRLCGWVSPFPVVDPRVIDQGMDRLRKGSRQLSKVCEHYDVNLTDAHTSQADADATIMLCRKMAHRFPGLRSLNLTELVEQEQQWYTAWAQNFEEYKRRSGEPSFTVRMRWPYGFNG
jgi:DNA polymerase-3 subunit epsilon